MYCRNFLPRRERLSAGIAWPRCWVGTSASLIAPLTCTSAICGRNSDHFPTAQRESARYGTQDISTPALACRGDCRACYDQGPFLEGCRRILGFRGSLHHRHTTPARESWRVQYSVRLGTYKPTFGISYYFSCSDVVCHPFGYAPGTLAQICSTKVCFGRARRPRR